MLEIGLTGGIGSGKTRVADLFAARGAAIIDTDLLAHEITAPHGLAIPALVEAFGPQCLRPDGAMDRDAMRALVFADPAAKARLEAITHPLIRQLTESRAAAVRAGGRHPYLIYVVPLLVESGSWRQRVGRVLVVDCSEATQVARVMSRNGFTRPQVEAIMARQATRAQRLAQADDVIDNEGRPEALAPQVERLDRLYRSQAAAAPLHTAD
ncbi:dephospho-CoA kinase [Cupriavidus sp. USMAA2-4]|uniref:Dephospho-CoA kinase n=1 Tax=Cupriavidus malaysiensis TaxID=367825 RepID=A0ABN4TQN6_9BURK|nr:MULTISPECIES: dephospho-CoA kinase [Cupriavidus]AOY92682.1 dephospho-CoA kinase [Cupriavidus sp. USMAA2-4]AOZ00845.1 dephospho-CoA kinase [Cupriavidus sp. USMAHM13]AOZ07605.1 dephospho-CoA kinase [Cupriavidus malaysiensis]